nr:hypothetical protein [Streptomyces antimycoticus]
MSRFNETLPQTRPAVALLGDYTRFSGLSRYLVYRWFTDPGATRPLSRRGPRPAGQGLHRGAPDCVHGGHHGQGRGDRRVAAGGQPRVRRALAVA